MFDGKIFSFFTVFVVKIRTFSSFAPVHCKAGLIFQFKCFAVDSMMMMMSHLDTFEMLGRTIIKGFQTF